MVLLLYCSQSYFRDEGVQLDVFNPAEYEAGDEESLSRMCLARRFRVKVSAHDGCISSMIKDAGMKTDICHFVTVS
jgi:hypothetical protein